MICNSLDDIISEIVEDTSKEEVVLEKCTDRFDLADYKFGMMIVVNANISELSVDNVDKYHKKIYAAMSSVPFITRHSELFFCCADDAYIPEDAAKYTVRNFLDMNYRDLPCFVFGFDLNFKYMHQLFRAICRLSKDALRVKLLKQRRSTKLIYTLDTSFVQYIGNYFNVPSFDEKPYIAEDVRMKIFDVFQFMEGNIRAL
jgi:hypothetical protein